MLRPMLGLAHRRRRPIGAEIGLAVARQAQ
jgi:hypothetical protein